MGYGVLLQIWPDVSHSDFANFLFFSIVGCALLYFVINRRSNVNRSHTTNSLPQGKDSLGQHVVFKYGVYEMQGRRMYMEDRYTVRGEISGGKYLLLLRLRFLFLFVFAPFVITVKHTRHSLTRLFNKTQTHRPPCLLSLTDTGVPQPRSIVPKRFIEISSPVVY